MDTIEMDNEERSFPISKLNDEIARMADQRKKLASSRLGSEKRRLTLSQILSRIVMVFGRTVETQCYPLNRSSERDMDGAEL
jgi:hypothetical protein